MVNKQLDDNKEKNTCITSGGMDFDELQWKALPHKVERKIDDPENIPIPKFSAIVDRCLKENKFQEVWDMVSVNKYFMF